MAEYLVSDSVESCPYLDNRTARLPLRFQTEQLSAAALDDSLAAGDRRTGTCLYRPSCPTCRACESLRIPVADFRPSRTQKRTFRRGQAEFTVRLGEPRVDETRVELFNLHRLRRGLADGQHRLLDVEYRNWFVDSCCETFELTVWDAKRLIAVAICDQGSESLSAVYCYYDCDYPQFSLGTFCVLQEIELCRQWKIDYLYLGFYIAQSPHMAYKSRFRPHERLINGEWVRNSD